MIVEVLEMKLTPSRPASKKPAAGTRVNHKSRTASFEFDDRVLALAKAGFTANV